MKWEFSYYSTSWGVKIKKSTKWKFIIKNNEFLWNLPSYSLQTLTPVIMTIQWDCETSYYMCFILPGGGTYLNNTLIIILVVEVYHSFKEEVSCQHGSQKIYTKSPFNDFISQNHNYENYKIICYNITPFQAKSKSKMHQENLLQYSSVPKRIIYTYNSEIFMSGTHDEIVDVFSLLKKYKNN